MKSNILLISENTSSAKKISEKFYLLRNSDAIEIVTFDEALSNLESGEKKLIFLCETATQEATKDLISLIKSKFPNLIIVLILNSMDSDFLMSMYDLGIDDYILSDSAPSEYLIKSVNLLKLAEKNELFNRNNSLLKVIGGISQADFYTARFANEIMEDALLHQEYSDSFFMIVTYDELDRVKFSDELLSSAIKTSLRNSDIVVDLDNGKYYILLSCVNKIGVEKVIEKIKNYVSAEFSIKVGVCEVRGRQFAELEKKASSALTDAMLSANDFVIYEEDDFIQDDNWVLDDTPQKKDFKLFKNIYAKKLTRVIAPVFFRMQAAYEGVLEDTIIEQFTDEKRCIFNLKSRRQMSRLSLIYPGLGKIVIYVTHSGLDSPENKEIVLSLKELTEPVLTDVMNLFVDEYKSCIDKKEE